MYNLLLTPPADVFHRAVLQIGGLWALQQRWVLGDSHNAMQRPIVGLFVEQVHWSVVSGAFLRIDYPSKMSSSHGFDGSG